MEGFFFLPWGLEYAHLCHGYQYACLRSMDANGLLSQTLWGGGGRRDWSGLFVTLSLDVLR